MKSLSSAIVACGVALGVTGCAPTNLPLGVEPGSFEAVIGFVSQLPGMEAPTIGVDRLARQYENHEDELEVSVVRASYGSSVSIGWGWEDSSRLTGDVEMTRIRATACTGEGANLDRIEASLVIEDQAQAEAFLARAAQWRVFENQFAGTNRYTYVNYGEQPEEQVTARGRPNSVYIYATWVADDQDVFRELSMSYSVAFNC